MLLRLIEIAAHRISVNSLFLSVASNEEQMLETALRMSMDAGAGNTAAAAPSQPRGAPDFSTMSEEEQIAYAMQMSIQDTGSKSQRLYESSGPLFYY